MDLTRDHRKPERSNGIRLSLSMIVKNEAQNLIPCIEPIRPVMDEIIIVDTGSSDSTREVAKGMGARVFDFPWCDDFSAARNESIRHARGDYILWLDADDRIDRPEIDKLKALKGRLPRDRTHAYYLTINNQSAIDGETLFRQLRIFPNVRGAIFQGRVHEQIFYTLRRRGIRFDHTDIVIRHTGYHDASAVIKKSERNLRIILRDLEFDPENPILHYNAARTLSGIGRHDEAISHMKKVADNPRIRQDEKRFFLEASVLLGKYYVEGKRLREAVSVFKELSEIFPEDGLIQFGLGESLLLTRDFAGARDALKQSLLHPLDVSLFPVNLNRYRYYQHYLLAQSYLETGEIEKAREMFSRSLHLHADHYKSLQALGLLLIREGKFEEALQYFEKAVAEGGASDGNLANLGLLYSKLGRLDEAEKALMRFLELNPESVEALAKLGHLHRAKEDYPKAIHFFTASLEKDTNLPHVRLALSDLYFRLGELEPVVEQCDALLKELSLPREITVSSLEGLSHLYGQIGEALSDRGEKELSLKAWQVAFLIHPSRKVLEGIASMAGSPAKMRSLVAEMEEALQFHGPQPRVVAGERFLTE